jgi:predicted nucleic acid-binding protein
LYTSLIIPEAVWDEVVEQGLGQPGANQVKEATWIKVKPVINKVLVRALERDLDAGEAEAIVLALELEP